MKKISLITAFVLLSGFCFGQKNLLSYDDIKYMLHNNLLQADTFLTAKGYLIAKKDNNNKNRKYALTTTGGTYSNVSVRSDGKRLFVEIETNEIDQYNLIKESISQYVSKDKDTMPKDTLGGDVQTYVVKDLGSIYITINDTVPYNPMRKEYDIHIVSDKKITAYN